MGKKKNVLFRFWVTKLNAIFLQFYELYKPIIKIARKPTGHPKLEIQQLNKIILRIALHRTQQLHRPNSQFQDCIAQNLYAITEIQPSKKKKEKENQNPRIVNSKVANSQIKNLNKPMQHYQKNQDRKTH